MPSTTAVLVPLVIAALVVIANAVVNTKIKFAPDEQTAQKQLKALALRVLGWVANGYVLVLLVLEVTSSDPVTRMSVLVIALQLTVLSISVIMSFLGQVLGLLRDVVGAQVMHVGASREMAKALREVVEQAGMSTKKENDKG